MANLSEDIIADILSRLPVKFVGRFRCVSKSWLHLTTQPHFIQTHLNRTQTQKLILSSHSLFSLDHLATIDDDMLPLELDFPLNTPLKTKWVLVSGSYNGLVCIMPQPEAFFIFNPSTRESMRVPDCPMPSHACPQQGVRFHRHAHGFGHAPPMSDYKFVKVAYGCMPLCYWKNTNILLVRNQKQLLMCNRKDGTCKKFLVNGLPSDFNADVYVESLISPNFQQN
ncbi:hypothetical protein L3X38_022790 [Prunus dulcis]|uniref:F-box domain-containing protein n=1 Tax=Prunus dulcis TaxID=3755 RepID=A0AAD4Z4P7_PRUDU|nr:hypothetical protein L3X38_022790 [Prunus dulcis]